MKAAQAKAQQQANLARHAAAFPGGAAQAQALAQPNVPDPQRISDPAAGNWDARYQAAQAAAARAVLQRLMGGGTPQSAMSYPQLVGRGPAYGSQENRPLLQTQPSPPPVGQDPRAAVLAEMQGRGDTDPGFQPGSQEYAAFTTLIGTGMDPEEARIKVLRDYMAGPSSGIGDEVIGGIGDAASGAYDSSVGRSVRKGIGFINDQYQRAYEWNQKQLGDDIIRYVESNGEATILNPYWATRSGDVGVWVRDPENQAKVRGVLENGGLDLDGDGTIDVTGGTAIMLMVESELDKGFFDAIITSLGMDPLFALSFVAPAAATGRAGAQSAAEVATMAQLPKAQRVAMAVDRALSGITKAGDVGNRLADLPITGPVIAARKAGEAVGKVPMVGTTVRNKIGWLAEPSQRTAERIAANAARDAAQEAMNVPVPSGITSTAPPATGVKLTPALPERSVTNPPEFVGTPYGTAVGSAPVSPAMVAQPQALPATSVYPDYRVGPGGQVEPTAPAPAAATRYTGEGVPDTSSRPMPAPEPTPPAPPPIPIRRSNAGGRPTAYVGLDGNVKVIARDGGVFEVQVRKPYGKTTRWVPERGFTSEQEALDYARGLVPSSTVVDDVADAVTPSAASDATQTPMDLPETPVIPSENAPDISWSHIMSTGSRGIEIVVPKKTPWGFALVRNPDTKRFRIVFIQDNGPMAVMEELPIGTNRRQAIALFDEYDTTTRAKLGVGPNDNLPDIPQATRANQASSMAEPDLAPMAPRYTVDGPVKRPFLLEEAPKQGDTWKSYLATNHPEAYARIREKLADTAYAYEVRINQAPTKIDKSIEMGGWAATLRRAAREEGITDLPPWQGGPKARDAGNAGNLDMRAGRVIFEPDEAVAKADRNVLYAKGELRKSPPRASLAEEIRTAALPTRKGWDKVTITENGERITYTNVGLSGLPQETRDEIARIAVEQQQLAFERFRRIQAIREELHGPVTGTRPSNAAGFLDQPTRMMMRATDALNPVGQPIAPRIPDAPVAQARFDKRYNHDFARMNTPQQWRQTGDLGDDGYDYLVQVVGEGENARSAYDVLADLIDKKAADSTIDWANAAAVRRASREILNEYAATMLELTGVRLPSAVRKQLERALLQRVARALGTLNQIAREGGLYNVVTGPRGWAQDVISSSIKAAWEGNTGAIASILSPKQFIAVARGTPDALDAMAARLGIDIPDELRVMSKFDTEVEETGRTALNRALSDTFGVPEGSAKDRAIGFLTAPINSRFIAKGRATHENLIRRATMMDEMQLQMPAAAREFRRRSAKVAERYGVMESSFYAYVYELGDQFSPADVRRTMLELGQDAGMTGNAVNEFADKVAQEWRRAVNTVRNDAYQKTRRVFYTYERTNTDEFLGKFIFYHYWMSRSIPSYTRLALRNPELAALWFRAWDETMKRAEEKGFPPGLRGFIQYAGSADGFTRFLNPIQFFIPFDILISDPYADTPYEQVTQFAMVSPVVQGVAAAVGLSDRPVDQLMTHSVRNFAVAHLNWLRSNGYLGLDRRLQDDWYEQGLIKGQELANRLALTTGAPFVERAAFNDRNVYNQDVLSYVLRDVIAEDMGIPFGDTPEWQPGGAAFEAWSEARLALINGDDNEYADQAFALWGDETVRNQYLNLIPGGSRMRYSPRDQAMALAREGYAALDTGELTPDQQAAMDFRSAALSGSEEDLELDRLQDGYANIGTPRQREIADAWTQIVRKIEDVPPGHQLVVGGRVWFAHDLAQLTEEQRETLADRWLAEHGLTDEHAAYKQERRAYVEQHPEFGAFKDWESLAYDYEGGLRTFRADRAAGNPNFKRAMEAKERSLRDQGTDPALIPDELDAWAPTLAAYKAANGIKDSVYADDPISTGDQGTVNTLLQAMDTKGGGSGKTVPKTTAEKIKLDLAEYEKEAAVFAAILQNAGITADPATINNPLMQRALGAQFGDLMPKQSKLLRTYLAWRDSMPPGTDTSPEAFARVMDQVNDEAA